jgi:hypothetical protein
LCSTRRNWFPTWDLRPYVNAIHQCPFCVPQETARVEISFRGTTSARCVFRLKRRIASTHAYGYISRKRSHFAAKPASRAKRSFVHTLTENALAALADTDHARFRLFLSCMWPPGLVRWRRVSCSRGHWTDRSREGVTGPLPSLPPCCSCAGDWCRFSLAPLMCAPRGGDSRFIPQNSRRSRC